MSERPSLPYIDIFQFEGLTTKASPEILDPMKGNLAARILENGDLFKMYGSISKSRGNKPLLAAQYAENSVVQPISWIAPYRYPDLNGLLLKEVLVNAGTKIAKHNPTTPAGGGLDILGSGYKTIFRTSAQIDRYLLITGQDPYDISLKDKMSKYDGLTLSDWGVKAPGELEYSVETFDSLTNWATFGASSTLATETTISVSTASLKATKITGTTVFGAARTNSYDFYVPTTSAGRLRFWFYASPDHFVDLRQLLMVFTASTSNPLTLIPATDPKITFTFDIGLLIPGWNLLICDFQYGGAVYGASWGGSTGPRPASLHIKGIGFWVTVANSAIDLPISVYLDEMVVLESGTVTPTAVYSIPTPLVTMEVAGKLLENFETNPASSYFLVNSPNQIGNMNSFGFYTEGAGALGLDKRITTSTDVTATQILTHGINLTDATQLQISLYIPSITDLATSACVKIRFTAAGSDYYEYQWDKSEIVAGWNLLTMDPNTAPTGGTGISSGTLSAAEKAEIIGTTYTVTLDAVGKILNGIIWDRLLKLNNANMKNYLSGSADQLNMFNVVNQDPNNVLSDKYVALIKEDMKSVNLSFARTGSWNVSDAVNTAKSLAFNVYIPAKTSTYYALKPTGTALEIRFGNSDLTSYDHKTWALADLDVGWNRLYISTANADRVKVNGGAPDLTAVATFSWTFVFNKADDVGADFRVGNVELNALPSGTILQGTWRYKVTYENSTGTESNAGPASASVTIPVGGQAGVVNLTNIPISTNTSVIRRNIYRTTSNGETFLYLTPIEDNTTTVYTDTVTDGGLGLTQPPMAGDPDSIDSTPPPSANIVHVWKRTVFLAGDPFNPHVLFFSKGSDFESFPLLNAFELDSRITGIYDTYLGLIVTTESTTWRLLGSNPDFVIEKVIQGIGAVGPRAVGNSRLAGWALDRDGIRLYDLQNNMKISEVIRDKFDGADKTYWHLSHGVHSRKNNYYMIFLPISITGDIANYGTIYKYEYLEDQITQGFWSTVICPGVNLISSAEVEDVKGDRKVYVGSKDGMLFEMFEDSTFTWYTGPKVGSAIKLKWVSPYMRLGKMALDTLGVQGRVLPRFIELRTFDFTRSGSTGITPWTVTIDLADGSWDGTTPKATKVIPFNFPPDKSLLRWPFVASEAADYFRIQIEHTSYNNVALLGVRVYFAAFPHQTEIIS